jgi:putative membrane protein
MSSQGEGRLALLVAVISNIALSALFILIYGNPVAADSSKVAFLPAVNAACNAVSTVLLILGMLAIKKGNRLGHERLMKSAFVSSSLFLIGYIVYHSFHGDTPFRGTGPIRPVYFTILISHIVLSVVAFPLVLFTFAVALKNNLVLHKRVARYTFPLWLYVSFTGVAIFLMLKHFQPD